MTRADHAALLRERRDPYRTLVAAILHQAVVDVRSPLDVWPMGDGRPDSRCTKAAARRFLSGQDADCTTLCELVDCEPQTIVCRLRHAAGLEAA